MISYTLHTLLADPINGATIVTNVSVKPFLREDPPFVSVCPCTFMISREAGTRDNRFFREQSEGLSEVEADGARYIPYLGKAKLVANPYVERVGDLRWAMT